MFGMKLITPQLERSIHSCSVRSGRQCLIAHSALIRFGLRWRTFRGNTGLRFDASTRQAVTVHYAGGMLLDMISVSESHTYPEFRFGLIRIVWARQCKFLAGSLKMLLFLSIVKLEADFFGAFGGLMADVLTFSCLGCYRRSEFN